MSVPAVESKLSYPVGFEEAVLPMLGPVASTSGARSFLYGDQEQFQKLKGESVERVMKELGIIRSFPAQKKGTLLPMLKSLGEKRRMIAQKIGTEDYEAFGRLAVAPLLQPKAITCLTHPRLKEFNQKIRSLFHKAIKEDKVGQRVVDTNFSRYTIERFTPNVIRALFTQATEDYRKSPVQNPKIDLLDSFDDISETVKAADLPGVKIPDKPDVIPYTIGTLEFLVGTVEAKMKGEWKVLTRHVVWLNNPSGEKGAITDEMLAHFERYSFATLLHTPRPEVEADLVALDKLTDKLIRNEYKNPKEFDRDLAFWEHRLFHIMPFDRGSASIIEIFREAICRIQKRDIPNRRDEDAMAEPDVEKYISSKF